MSDHKCDVWCDPQRRPPWKDVLWFGAIVVAGTVAMVALAWWLLPQRIDLSKPHEVVYSWWPPVENVYSCNAGKHSIRCWVKHEGWQPVNRDLTNFPGDMIQPGDVVGVRYLITDTTIELAYVKQGSTGANGGAYCKRSWKSCTYPGEQKQ